MHIPHDEDGDAMRLVLEEGSDISRPMDIDFMIACEDLASAEEIAPLAEARGYSVTIDVDEDEDTVTCICKRHLFLDYDAIIAAQQDLDSIAKPRGGYTDGWGTFGNVTLPEA